MKTLKTINKYLIAIVFLLFISCEEEDVADGVGEFDGSIASVEQFFTPEIVDALNDLGFIINSGDNPPNIEGTFLAAPFVLVDSSVPGDSAAGTQFYDVLITFLHQDLNGVLTIDATTETIGIDETTNGSGSFVSGSGNKFTAYIKSEAMLNGSNATVAIAISGTITATGINNLLFANLMLDDKGDPLDALIPNNTGRFLADANLFSEKQ